MGEYNPKPKKFDRYALDVFMSPLLQWGYDYNFFNEYLYQMLGKVSVRLLAHKYGMTLVWNGWRRDSVVQEMKDDPYMVVCYASGIQSKDSRTDTIRRDTFRNLMIKGKEAGLWTFHGRTGKQQGVVSATDENFVRINPEAFRSMIEYHAQVGDLNIEVFKISYQCPGWYLVGGNSCTNVNRMNTWLEDEENTGKFKFMVHGTHDEQELLIRLTNDKTDVDMLCMLSFLSQFNLAEMNQRYYQDDEEETRANQLLPNIPRDLLDDQLFSKEVLDAKVKTIEEKIEDIKKLSCSIKALRATLKKLEDYGGYEKLLSNMGKDLAKTLPTLSMVWLSESNYIARNIATAFVEGKLQINLPGIQAVKE